MLKNYFKLAWRNIVKDRQFTVLNLVGLSTGLACAILIFLWVKDELSVDKFNRNDKQLYQVMNNITTPNGVETIENTQGLLASALASEMPEVAYAASVVPSTWFSNKGLVSFKDKQLRTGTQFVSKDYFNIFSCDFVSGEKSQLFSAKNTTALSEELALKLFNTTDVVGKSVEWNQEGFNGSYSIIGVFKKFPSNATIQFDALFNYDLFLEKNPKLLNWGNSDPNTYLLLREGTKIEQFNKKIRSFIKSKNDKSTATLLAQRFSDKYLYNHYENGLVSGGRIEYVNLFSGIAIFIIIIACINFMNLSTAKALKRVKEVGVQKVMGASRRLLVFQYMGESLLMAFLSLFIAVLIIAILLPAFRQITGKDFISLPLNSSFIFSIIGITSITGLIAGSYPALYLSRFKPAQVLKGKLKNSLSESLVRKGLVVFQFAISVILIVSVLVIYKQMKLIQTTNLGYSRDHVLYFEKGGKLSDNKDDYKEGGKYEKDLETFIQAVKGLPGVVNASNFRHNITNRHGGTTDVSWQGKTADNEIAFTDIAAGYDFIETLGIKLKAGRTYSKEFGLEKSKVVFNEAAVASMGIKDPVGKIVNIWGEEKEIIGVTENFHFESLYENIKPCFFDFSLNQRASKIMVRIKAGTKNSTIGKLEKFYKEYTGEPIDLKFLDDDYQALYASEQRVAVLSRYFAGIAIIISCLGLFGLAAFTAQKRQKEIGIRKVVGASVANVMAILSVDFLKLVIVALLIAVPISWWIANQWLQGFAYRTEIGADVFALTVVSVLAITLFTISFQTIKAALANPVKSLRTE